MKNTIKFIHVADTHLGYRQYNLKERFRDYNRAFKRLLEKAIDYEVDFIVHSGDMFHHSNINPETLTATLTMISQFKEESEQKLGRVIPILAIQGNHDQRGYRRLRSWMEVLAELELIVLLDAQYDKETNSFPFVPASVVNPKGGMIEIGNIRVFGIPAYGSISKDLLPYIYESLPPKDDHFNLLMMHFGIEGQVSNKFGLDVTNQDLNKLKEKVDYLALGHFHRQYSLPSENPWIFNPGSLEVVEMEEVYEQFNRGAFMIESKRDKSNSSKWRKKITPIICANGSAVDDDLLSNRCFLNPIIDLDEGEMSSFDQTIEYVLNQIPKYGVKKRKNANLLKENKSEQNILDQNVDFSNPDIPILAILLKGTISYSKTTINLRELKERVMNSFEVLEIRLSTKLDSAVDGISLSGEKFSSIKQIERAVFSQIIRDYSHLAENKKEVLELVFDVKSKLLDSDTEVEDITSTISDWWESHEELFKVIDSSNDLKNEKKKSKSDQNSNLNKHAGGTKREDKEKNKTSKKEKGEEKSLEDFDFDDGIDLDDEYGLGEPDFY